MNTNRRLLPIVVCLMLAVAPCIAQESLEKKVDDFVAAEMQKQRIPGLSLAAQANTDAIARGVAAIYNPELTPEIKK